MSSKKAELPDFAQTELDKFMQGGHAGSITFHSDGQMIRQAEIKTVVRGDSTKTR